MVLTKVEVDEIFVYDRVIAQGAPEWETRRVVCLKQRRVRKGDKSVWDWNRRRAEAPAGNQVRAEGIRATPIVPPGTAGLRQTEKPPFQFTIKALFTGLSIHAIIHPAIVSQKQSPFTALSHEFEPAPLWEICQLLGSVFVNTHVTLNTLVGTK